MLYVIILFYWCFAVVLFCLFECVYVYVAIGGLYHYCHYIVAMYNTTNKCQENNQLT